MRGPILTVALVILLAVSARGQGQCVDNGADHGRFAFKNRRAPSTIPDVAPISVADVVKFFVPHVEGEDVNRPVVNEERQILHLRGFVRQFSCEVDGDYHVEIADTRAPKARRVIAEAPSSQPEIRSTLERLLGGPPTKHGKPFNGPKAVAIEVWGWRFLDTDHQFALVDKHTGKRRTMAQLKKGHKHGSPLVGTLWEVHPMFRVQSWTPQTDEDRQRLSSLFSDRALDRSPWPFSPERRRNPLDSSPDPAHSSRIQSR